MTIGDIGGPVTELVITCMTKPAGDVDIKKGDALCLLQLGYIVGKAYGAIFGQSLVDCDKNNAGIPVRVRGVCEFKMLMCDTTRMIIYNNKPEQLPSFIATKTGYIKFSKFVVGNGKMLKLCASGLIEVLI